MVIVVGTFGILPLSFPEPLPSIGSTTGEAAVEEGTRCEIIFLVPSPLKTIFEIKLQFERDLEFLTQYEDPLSLRDPWSSKMVILSGTVELALKDALRWTGGAGGRPREQLLVPDPFLPDDNGTHNLSSPLELRVGDANNLNAFSLC